MSRLHLALKDWAADAPDALECESSSLSLPVSLHVHELYHLRRIAAHTGRSLDEVARELLSAAVADALDALGIPSYSQQADICEAARAAQLKPALCADGS